MVRGLTALICILTLGVLGLAQLKYLTAKLDPNSAPAAFLKSAERWSGARRSEFSSGISVLEANLLRYSQVKFSGNYYTAADELCKALNLEPDMWIWEISPEDIRDKLRGLSWVRTAEVDWKLFPLRLNVFIEEHEPWLVAEYEGHTWVLSRSLTLIVPLKAVTDPELIVELADLPRLSGLMAKPSEASYLSSPNARLRHAAEMIRMLGQAGDPPFPIEQYTLLEDGSLMLKPRDAKMFPQARVSVTSLEDAQQVSAKIAAVLLDLAAKRESAREIDLRFANQAVIR